MLSTRRKTQAVFAVGDHSIDALEEGKIVFAFYRLGRQAAFFDFSELISMCKTTHREIVSIDKYIEDATLVRAHSCTEKYFGDEWTRLEWLQHGWIDECQTRSFHAVQRLHDHSLVHAARTTRFYSRIVCCERRQMSHLPRGLTNMRHSAPSYAFTNQVP